MMYIGGSKDTIELIFYKLLFYFDKFQPGDVWFWADEFPARPEKMPADIDIPLSITKKMMFKLGDGGTEAGAAIAMAHINDPEGDFHGIVVEFPKIPYAPKIFIKDNETGVGVGCDGQALKLKSDMSKSDEREAFEFFIHKISSVVSECTGN